MVNFLALIMNLVDIADWWEIIAELNALPPAEREARAQAIYERIRYGRKESQAV